MWANIMASKSCSQKIAYIDLFAGPGRYKDGSKSTPIKVLEQIINNEKLRDRVITIFNDADKNYATNLESEIKNLKGIELLKYPPTVFNLNVGDDMVDLFEHTSLVPTLSFADPWGYKGLSSKLLTALIKDWGSDSIFFFNYNRINMGISNPMVQPHMDAIFGVEKAAKLRTNVRNLKPQEREATILNELAKTLSARGKIFVLPFRFARENGRTSHYLIFVSKHVLGYSLMKEIMYRYSSEHTDGVASFSYIPVGNLQLDFLSMFLKPIEELGDELLKTFAGETLTVKQIYDQHQVGTPFVLKNYKDAILKLETDGRVSCDPPKRRKRSGTLTLGDAVKVTFP